MLASPFLVGVLATGPTWRHVPLALFWVAGYFAFFAVSMWLKSGRKPRFVRPAATYSVVAGVLGVAVLLTSPGLVVWLPAFVLPLGVGLWAATNRRDRDLVVGLATTLGSAVMTVVAGEVGQHPDLLRTGALALVQAAYFAGTVYYVKSAIRERDNARFLAISVLFHAGCASVLGYLWWPLGIVFVALTVRALVVPPRHPSPKALGIGEIVATLVVAVVSLLVVTAP